ncbi:unconventional prefoldin RPB5 interactor-like isoform X2 [Physella acuta]|uniref:unconventional prefoldin RPB5 interactor-like isoform X2 n=1 Tax=Physella acuta TaxID=109671 RepID=UPI0027DE0BD3|nr:unconventional prefoldin RPB5 interactor-like isoform X2 [Physella acuta]
MDPKHLARLKEEQQKAIQETDTKIEQMEKFKTDYKALQDRLKTLPDKITHDVMVPFGKLAFMPGQIVHTNEILVLLGDNWFVERSAKQAAEIAERRIKELNKTVNGLKSQRKLLEPRIDFTSQLQAELMGQGDVNEIVEEFDEEKEKLWDEQHKKNVRRYKEELKHKTNEPARSEMNAVNTDLWSRLDELERLEAEKGELKSSESEDEEADSRVVDTKVTLEKKPSNKAVQWEDTQTHTSSQEEESEDDNLSNEDEEEVAGQEVKRIITFHHTPTPAILPHQVMTEGDTSIQSPADIYKLYCPKPILKKVICEETNENISQNMDKMVASLEEDRTEYCLFTEKDSNCSEHRSSSTDSFSYEKTQSKASLAFTGMVVEKSDVSKSDTPNLIPKDDPPKRVSKFRSERMSQH